MSAFYLFTLRPEDSGGNPQEGTPHLSLHTIAWGLTNVTDAHTTRVFNMPVYGGFKTRGLKRNASTKQIKGAYAPRYGIFSDWREPLHTLEGWQGLELEVFYLVNDPSTAGGSRWVSEGIWILEKVNFSKGAFIGGVPQKVDWTLSLIEVDRGDV